VEEWSGVKAIDERRREETTGVERRRERKIKF